MLITENEACSRDLTGLKAVVCTLEIGVSCVTEAEDEGHSSSARSLEIGTGSKGLACFIREEARCFKNYLSVSVIRS